MSYRDRFLKLNLLPLRYRMDLKDLVIIFKAKGYQDFHLQTEIHHRTRNACKVFKVKLPHTLCKTKLCKTLILL